MSPAAWRWHRRFGLLGSAGLLLWGMSGALHPLMSAWQPRPVNFEAPQAALALGRLVSPLEVLARHGITQFEQLRVLAEPACACYQVIRDNEALYFDALSGAPQPDADRAYAAALAAHFLGQPVEKAAAFQKLTEFGGEYTEVNRLLPVWRVSFKDGRRAYVHTPTSRLATISDDRKALLSRIFQTLHNADWIAGPEPLRLTLVTLLLSPLLIAGLSGLWVFGGRWRQGTPNGETRWRRWHRRTGLLVSLALLSAVGSGLLHLFKFSPITSEPAAIPGESFRTVELQDMRGPPAFHFAMRELQLARVDDELYLQGFPLRTDSPATSDMHHGHAASSTSSTQRVVEYWSANSRLGTVTEEQHARSLARHYSGYGDRDILALERVTQFGGEYGFINKLLPVWRVAYRGEGNPRYYVDTASGRLAARVNDNDAREGWIFAYLHKWEWLKPAGRSVLNAVTVSFALGYVTLAILGLGLYWRRKSL